MASLSLGPALKAQFLASAGNAEQSLTGAQEAEASTSPAGRGRPRKGTPKRSPFDDDLWNDELEEFLIPDLECCADEDECIPDSECCADEDE
eukprot:1639546-Rhodomonas_salina.1